MVIVVCPSLLVKLFEETFALVASLSPFSNPTLFVVSPHNWTFMETSQHIKKLLLIVQPSSKAE